MRRAWHHVELDVDVGGAKALGMVPALLVEQVDVADADPRWGAGPAARRAAPLPRTAAPRWPARNSSRRRSPSPSSTCSSPPGRTSSSCSGPCSSRSRCSFRGTRSTDPSCASASCSPPSAGPGSSSGRCSGGWSRRPPRPGPGRGWSPRRGASGWPRSSSACSSSPAANPPRWPTAPRARNRPGRS